jgi:hypothetical protein
MTPWLAAVAVTAVGAETLAVVMGTVTLGVKDKAAPSWASTAQIIVELAERLLQVTVPAPAAALNSRLLLKGGDTAAWAWVKVPCPRLVQLLGAAGQFAPRRNVAVTVELPMLA